MPVPAICRFNTLSAGRIPGVLWAHRLVDLRIPSAPPATNVATWPFRSLGTPPTAIYRPPATTFTHRATRSRPRAAAGTPTISEVDHALQQHCELADPIRNLGRDHKAQICRPRVPAADGTRTKARLYQVKIQFPASMPSGDQPTTIVQGSFQSAAGILLNIQ